MEGRLTKVKLRADEDSQIGSGHVMRCYALACKFRDAGWDITFYSKNIGAKTSERLKNRGLRLVIISLEAEFLNSIERSSIVVIDSYAYGDKEWSDLKNCNPKVTICIDDVRDVKYWADIIICPNEGIEYSRIQKRVNSSLFLGAKYSLIRPEIYEAKRKNVLDDERKGIVIANGGCKNIEWIRNTIGAIKDIGWKNSYITVISGHVKAATQLTVPNSCQTTERIRVEIGLSESAMSSIYSRSEVVIVPCSTMMLEAFILGCPVITGWVFENHRISLNYYSISGMCLSAGYLTNASKKRLSKSIDWIQDNRCEILTRQEIFTQNMHAGLDEIVKEIKCRLMTFV